MCIIGILTTSLQCNVWLESPGLLNLTRTWIYYHFLSVPGNSNVTHCEPYIQCSIKIIMTRFALNYTMCHFLITKCPSKSLSLLGNLACACHLWLSIVCTCCCRNCPPLYSCMFLSSCTYVVLAPVVIQGKFSSNLKFSNLTYFVAVLLILALITDLYASC